MRRNRQRRIPAGTVLLPLQAMRLRCALNHEWDGTNEVIHRGYKPSPSGRRLIPVHESIYTPPVCPTCGHKCMGGVPRAILTDSRPNSC